MVLGEDCVAKSLLLKETGEECLDLQETLPLFCLTEPRPFNNEIKLAHPNKRTIFQANRVRREGDRLIVGFELVLFEAVVTLTVKPDYITFTLTEFLMDEKAFEGLHMDPPPMEEFCLLQLPIKNRKCFGEWLNVSHDEKIAINVLATDPRVCVDALRRKDCRIMTASVRQDIGMKGHGAALIVSPKASLLDCIAQIEEDYDLPKGVKSRRSDAINASIYWSEEITPATVDMHIHYAKQCGISMMLLYYPCIFPSYGYYYCGDYKTLREEYPNGLEDLRAMLQKIKDAGITPGIHFLHTHIGLKSHYCTPEADHRLNLTRHFTLAKNLSAEDTTVYVEENPRGSMMYKTRRVLKFGTKLIHYEGYTEEPPYCFTGCVRGWNDTYAKAQSVGTIGGLLDISEYGGISVYVDQNSSLQDEVADNLAAIYDTGFSFIYFDGSEGTNPPCGFHVANAQYRVYRKTNIPPLFTEGAAKTHFSWHMLSGGNAFDVFPTCVFKDKIVEFPAEEAPRMAQDFTRLNFGWWKYRADIQPDMYEFGTSRAAAWDCPVTMMADPEAFAQNPRTEDNFQVLARWEDVRRKKLLTQAQKDALKDCAQEHILLVNEQANTSCCPMTGSRWRRQPGQRLCIPPGR